ncbi:outer membrane protein with beta-barrel domain [Algoriphagus boseongensis]|uniref:Outer membrane protein with beta-barrel domain n=1 Tax=Algoriphagus boseongensis TaxID=1442587 RepID=A0A4V3D231_9BACT|nr:outer membrane beta-barrel protein [Algoriphagus boseongensis]TDQ16593.1 outer membrane protein with beta-barrel domain [Algoriphagus boseongensis]
MKRIFGVLFALLLIQGAYAQRAGAFRFGVDLGAAIPKNGGAGFLFNLEPQILVKDNLAVGLRLGVAALAKDVTYYSSIDEFDGEVSANTSIVATANYYFNNGNSRVAPYIGAGFGYYGLANIDFETFDPDQPVGELAANYVWSPMIRAGIELAKFRLGAEYNFLPTSDLQDTNGNVVGEAINQYFGFTLGFTIGGGKWGK